MALDMLQGTQVTIAVADYDIQQPQSGVEDTVALGIDLNSGTCTASLTCRPHGSTLPFTACQAIPRSSGTATSAITASDVYMVDATGIDLRLTVSAAAGSPHAVWGYGSAR